MPRIYTKDTVGEMIEDSYLGSIGIATGSLANAIALEQRRTEERRKREETTRLAQTAQDAADNFVPLAYFPPAIPIPTAKPDPVMKAIREFISGTLFVLFIIGFLLNLFGQLS